MEMLLIKFFSRSNLVYKKPICESILITTWLSPIKKIQRKRAYFQSHSVFLNTMQNILSSQEGILCS